MRLRPLRRPSIEKGFTRMIPGRRAAPSNRPPCWRRENRLHDMHLATRKALYRRLQAANPEPTTELLYDTPFELLVAVMLSAHTTDKAVNVATRKLFPVANTPEAIAKLGE